jgi:hypothetical protein
MYQMLALILDRRKIQSIIIVLIYSVLLGYFLVRMLIYGVR